MNLKRYFLKPLALRLAVGLLTILLGFGAFDFWLYHNNPVVLEISTDCRGMTYPRGEVLEFRLYKNGRLEYDDFPQQEEWAHFKPRYWFPRTHSHLAAPTVNEIAQLAEQPDFLSAQSEYPAAIPGIDSEFRTSIVFTHANVKKRIVVIDYLSDDGMGDTKNYPLSLVRLLQTAYAAKSKS